jgi:hypothetical protein
MKISKRKPKHPLSIKIEDMPVSLRHLAIGSAVDMFLPKNKISLADKIKIGKEIENRIIQRHYPIESYECNICGDSSETPITCTQQANCLNISLAQEQNIKTK